MLKKSIKRSRMAPGGFVNTLTREHKRKVRENIREHDVAKFEIVGIEVKGVPNVRVKNQPVQPSPPTPTPPPKPTPTPPPPPPPTGQ